MAFGLEPEPVDSLAVGRGARRAAERHMRRAAPAEAAGLLAGRAVDRPSGGRSGRAGLYLPLRNTASDPLSRFRVEPDALGRALVRLGRRGLVALAVVHSHPRGPAAPSAHDSAGMWPELLTVLLSGPGATRWRAYRAPASGARTPRSLERRPLVLGLRPGRRRPAAGAATGAEPPS